MRSVAFVFPGQGSQAVGMGKEVCEASAAAAEVFERAQQVLGYDLAQLCFTGPEEKLRQTEHTQPALVACSLAILAAWHERTGVVPAMLAGHSVGEYSALAAAGVLSLEDTLRLVQARGNAMAQAGQARPGAMAAVFGLTADAVTALCHEVIEAGHGTLEIANLNSLDQIVVSGDVAAVEAAAPLATAAGARRYHRLAVSAAFHSSLMAEPALVLGGLIDAAQMADARIPVVTNVTASPLQHGSDLRGALRAQLASRVRWVEMVIAMREAGITTFIELGPGTALSGLIKKIDRTLQVVSITDSAGLDKALAAAAALA